MHQRHAETLSQTAITDADLQGAVGTLRRLERFWMLATDFSSRPGQFAA
jgi:hypothetical protein